MSRRTLQFQSPLEVDCQPGRQLASEHRQMEEGQGQEDTTVSNLSSMKIRAPDHVEGGVDGVSEQCFDNPGYESAASSVASSRTVISPPPGRSRLSVISSPPRHPQPARVSVISPPPSRAARPSLD